MSTTCETVGSKQGTGQRMLPLGCSVNGKPGAHFARIGGSTTADL